METEQETKPKLSDLVAEWLVAAEHREQLPFEKTPEGRMYLKYDTIRIGRADGMYDIALLYRGNEVHAYKPNLRHASLPTDIVTLNGLEGRVEVFMNREGDISA